MASRGGGITAEQFQGDSFLQFDLQSILRDNILLLRDNQRTKKEHLHFTYQVFNKEWTIPVPFAKSKKKNFRKQRQHE